MAMLRKRALGLLAALCGCLGNDMMDSTILLQTDPTQVHQLGTELVRQAAVPSLAVVLAEQDADAWPDFASDIWDTVKDSVAEVTGELGDISQVFDKGVGDLLYNKTMETAAVVFAQSLAKALTVIDSATAKLRNRTLAAKAELLSMVNQTKKALPGFAEAMNATLQKAFSDWGRVRSVVGVAGSMIGSSFERAGQANLAEEFQKVFDAGLANVDSYVSSVQNASRDLRGLAEDTALPILRLHLQSADNYFRQSVARVPQFATLFQQAFQGAVDHTLDALPVATERVQGAFSEVMGNVSDIAFELRSSSRELTETCHSLLTYVAKSNNIELPVWEDLPEPVPYSPHRPISDYSGATHFSGSFAFGTLALLLASRA